MKINLNTIFDSAVANNNTRFSTEESVQHLYGYYIELAYTGSTLTGTAIIQVSADAVLWRNAPDSGSTAHHTVAASGGNVQWNVDGVYYAYVRVAFTSGDANAATVTAKIHTKGF